jgi:hypothetical protein
MWWYLIVDSTSVLQECGTSVQLTWVGEHRKWIVRLMYCRFYIRLFWQRLETILIFCVPCILYVQDILPTNVHKTYILLKYKIHKNVIVTPQHVSVYAITPSSGGYQMCSLLRLLHYKNSSYTRFTFTTILLCKYCIYIYNLPGSVTELLHHTFNNTYKY